MVKAGPVGVLLRFVCYVRLADGRNGQRDSRILKQGISYLRCLFVEDLIRRNIHMQISKT